jgi:hypothetical protein
MRVTDSVVVGRVDCLVDEGVVIHRTSRYAPSFRLKRITSRLEGSTADIVGQFIRLDISLEHYAYPSHPLEIRLV